MFLLIHDEIMGPEIKCSYFKNPISLSKEFISKMYISHAGFTSSSHLEIKFENYRSISCFTGNLARRSNKEGILGIIFEEDEEFDNLDLFLQRNLYDAIEKPTNQTLHEIFSKKLLNYLELNELFKKVEIESIPEIFIMNGYEQYKYCVLKVGGNNISISKMTELYRKIISKKIIPQYHFVELNLDERDKTFLVLKSNSNTKIIEKMVTTIKLYLEKYFDYSLEILSLLFLPSMVKIIPFDQKFSKENLDRTRTFLKNLQQSNDYYSEFNNTILDLLKGDIYIAPSL